MKKFLFLFIFVFVGSYLFAQQNNNLTNEFFVASYFKTEDGEEFMFSCTIPIEYEGTYFCAAFNPCENTKYSFSSNNINTLNTFCIKYMEATKNVRGKKNCSLYDLRCARDIDVKNLFERDIKYKFLGTTIQKFDDKSIIIKMCELY